MAFELVSSLLACNCISASSCLSSAYEGGDKQTKRKKTFRHYGSRFVVFLSLSLARRRLFLLNATKKKIRVEHRYLPVCSTSCDERRVFASFVSLSLCFFVDNNFEFRRRRIFLSSSHIQARRHCRRNEKRKMV